MGWMGAEVYCRERKLAAACMTTAAEQLLPRYSTSLLEMKNCSERYVEAARAQALDIRNDARFGIRDI